MNDSDLHLLENYTQHNSQDSFAALVNRHLNLVFSAALRQVRSPQLAEEISQSVFSDLAQNATKLKSNTILAAWLYEVTRRTAIDVVRRESRRQLREKVAHELTAMNATAEDWKDIEPFLDEAMHALDETDRAAILLRYFENKTLREVGETLGTSDDAAQKRVSRAVERLREFFVKRGRTIGASGLVVVISANAVQAAPIGLAVTISTAAALAGTSIVATTATFTKTIAITTLQKTLISATLVAAVGTGIYEVRQAAQLREQNQMLLQQQAPLRVQIQQLQQERDEATNRLASLNGEIGKIKRDNSELLKLRAKVAHSLNEKEITNDPAFQKASLWIAKQEKLRQQFEEHPDQWIPEMKYLSNEEWLDQARKADMETATGIRCALSNVRVFATFKFAGKVGQALRFYMADHNQQLPESTSQLTGYFRKFKNPIDDAETILTRYQILTSEEQANPANHGAIIIQDPKTLVDHLDNAVLIGPGTTSSVPPPQWPPGFPAELESLSKSYSDVNHHGFLSIYDLESYATTPAQKESLSKFIKAATTPR